MTQEKKQLLDKTFQTFMHVGLKGENMDLLHDMVAKDVVGFGTTIDEKIFGLKELLELLIRQKEQSAGLEMNWKPEILDIHISVDENTAIYTNEIILYVTVDGNTIEMYIRVSVVLEYVQHNWMVVHWHASKPEQVESEKDTWGVQSWKEKAEELEKEVAARTADLVEKNRELKIEAALEKVRARSSAMQQTHELGEVITIIFQKLDEFDISVKDGVALITFIEGSKDLNEWMANPGFGTAMHFLLPYFDHPVLSNLWAAKNRGEDILIQRYSAEESRSFLHYIFEHSDFIHTPQPVKDYCLAAETYATNIAFQKHTAIFINDYSGISLTALEIDLLKRFSIVFEQTYTRFLDLQKAEAQTREAQIEAALERVRSISLAMHHTSELQSVIHSVHQELLKLNLSISGGSFIAINSEIDNEIHCWGAGGTADTSDEVHIPRFEKPFYTNLLHGIKKGPGFFTEAYTREEKIEFFTFLFGYEPWSKLDAQQKEATLSAPGGYTRSCIVSKHTSIFIINHTGEKFSDAENEILKRFGKVFEQSYTRFLDLQKAEAQAREAKIELSLERVRAKTMAMHNSADVAETVAVMFDELINLGVDKNARCGIGILDDDMKMEVWTAFSNTEENVGLIVGTLEMSLHPMLQIVYHAWKNGEAQSNYTLEGEDKKDYYRAINSMDYPVKFDLDNLPDIHYQNAFYFSEGIIYIFSIDILPTETGEIIKRFAKVFGQTYRRYLDLLKAEAQTREAEIQLSLERVRARSLAMHHTNELQDVVNVVAQQLMQMGIDMDGGVFIAINDEVAKDFSIWAAAGAADYVQKVTIPFLDRPTFTCLQNAIVQREAFFTESYSKEEKNEFLNHLFLHHPWNLNSAERKAELLARDGGYVRSVSVNRYTAIGITNHHGNKFSDAENAILVRFGAVLEQSYTRFLDLQKAEAQAREAQIEAALERVRSRSMAMHKSDELRSVVNTLYGELQSLQVNFHVVGIQLLPDQSMDVHMWLSTADGLYDNIIHWPFTDLPVFHEIYKARTTGDMLEYTMSESITKEFFEEYFKLEGVPQGRKVATQNVKLIDLCGAYQHLTGIFLMRYSEGNYSCYEKDIVNRFSKAFEQTYTRFLDLQKAESQAREAQIENALEKVRSRSLAMQSPDELIEVAQLLREEMGALGVEALETSSIYIYDENSGTTQCWFTIKNADNSGKAITDQMTIDLHETWVGQQMYDFYRSAEKQISIRMQGVQRIEWIRYCEEKTDLFGTSNFYGDTIPERTYHLVKFSNGFMGAAAPGEISKESRELLKRATAVFSFAYTRFRDLQVAEASARASMRQASLDRVRADISSMRNADDLYRITPLVFNELTTLGIPFIRCGVFIVHEKNKKVQVYLSTPEGKSLAVMNLPFDANELIAQSVAAWKKEEVYIQHWNQSDFIHWGKSMQEQGHVKDMKTYQDADVAPESLHLHFIPFTQGLLYVGSIEALANEQIDLVKALAKSFAIAYARYEDFVKLEHAKAEVESAMSELKATQSQLVQQEKLASLGQLTAGIAHEIKNPLNFVNNFSEVSLELIDESLEEMNRGAETRDETLVNENLAHIKSNIIKVLDHGTRANSIVNSMLMHSRQGNGNAEPIMLNDFIREYSNLAYHGMRAGNHSLDVQMIFNLDERVKEVPLIAEDFSRVVLNICNNAFDAMREKKKKDEVRGAKYEVNTKYEVRNTKYEVGEKGEANYLPILSIKTSLKNGKVLIQFEDNGPGISGEIKDKILQPFFTTKKGTEGTGLGLSISHDIIKAHGGLLQLETKEGKGSVFIIQIPINTNNG